METKEDTINMASALTKRDNKEDSDDEEMQVTSAFMVRSNIPIDPPGEILDDAIEVKAHFEYSMHPDFQNKIYAISDGGADSCILGKHAKVLSYIGRFANLVGYDPKTTKTDKVPIVTALIKAKLSLMGEHPVLLKVHESPYNPQSPITVLSEYQVQECGLVIDSVAKKHSSVYGKQGTQCFQLNQSSCIYFEDRGALMCFEIFPIEDDDEKMYDVINITSPFRWTS